MALQAGIVGLPNVGKSTLFNAVSNSAKAQASNYRFCTIEPNVGLVDVPDIRIGQLAELINPTRVVPTQLEIVDIAGLVKINELSNSSVVAGIQVVMNDYERMIDNMAKERSSYSWLNVCKKLEKKYNAVQQFQNYDSGKIREKYVNVYQNI